MQYQFQRSKRRWVGRTDAGRLLRAGPWNLVGLQDGFHAGEMPTLFPLPPLYPGTVEAVAGELLPTHVRKRGPGSRAVRERSPN